MGKRAYMTHHRHPEAFIRKALSLAFCFLLPEEWSVNSSDERFVVKVILSSLAHTSQYLRP